MSIEPKLPRQTRLIDKKVAMTSMLTAGVTLGVASIMLIVFQFLALRGALIDDLQVQARIVGNNSSAALLFEDRKAAEEILAGLALSPRVRNAV
ncbi:MAG: GGDEF-domain containing protein, partial [Massilia sp.]|nr:GGDEF-domain containing protein [Massilia sp.]